MRTSHKVGTAGAGAILLCVSFIEPWEGLWTVAKIDKIGTGQPVTVCYGATKAEIPNLKVGQKFTKKECADLLIKSLPKYWSGIAPCIHVDIPDSAKAALISASYNAGSSAVCKSPMVAKMNAGHVMEGCEAFKRWYIMARGRVVKGLINRRSGEATLCLDGITAPTPKAPETIWSKLLNFIHSIFKRS